MKAESDPISPDEYLLRRVRVEQFRSAKVPTVSPNAFEPRTAGREPDYDGISLYREACLASPLDALATVDPARRHEYGLVRVPVALLAVWNLTAVPKHDERVAGHVVVPELNATDYALDKAQYTPVKLALAEAASLPGNVVTDPRPPPPAA